MADVRRARLLAEVQKLRKALTRARAKAAREAAARQRLEAELGAVQSVLTETLEQQMAASEIFSLVSRSPANVQPVLDAVAQSAARLCGETDALIHRVEGDRLHRLAHVGPVLSISRSNPLTPGNAPGARGHRTARNPRPRHRR
jgi:hypothetical protein